MKSSAGPIATKASRPVRFLKGTSWQRPNDVVGVAGFVGGLSSEARAYFAAGGLGILIGDGALNYRPEKVLETYYSYSLNSWSSVMSIGLHFGVTQVVDGNWGIQAIIKKSLFAGTATA